MASNKCSNEEIRPVYRKFIPTHVRMEHPDFSDGCYIREGFSGIWKDVYFFSPPEENSMAVWFDSKIKESEKASDSSGSFPLTLISKKEYDRRMKSYEYKNLSELPVKLQFNCDPKRIASFPKEKLPHTIQDFYFLCPWEEKENSTEWFYNKLSENKNSEFCQEHSGITLLNDREYHELMEEIK